MNKRTVTEFSLRSERTKQSLNALKLENEFKPIKTFNPYSTKSRLFGFDKLTYFRGNHSVAGKQCTVAL